MTNKSIEKIQELDNQLVAIIQDFLLLTPISWPKESMRVFLKNAASGNLKLPKIQYPDNNCNDKIDGLKAYLKNLGTSLDPAISFLRDTAESYLNAYRILQGVGTADVSEFSKILYGSPTDILSGYKRSNIAIAKYFLRISDAYKLTEDDPLIYTAHDFKQKLAKRITQEIKIENDPINIFVDSSIVARVAAGSDYVKIRKGAMFSNKDLEQLFHHEVMIHTLTYINGRNQPILKTLGYNAPRTTATQEGLAVFAEYVNFSIDLVRLKRIALRIIAINMAEKGADFIDLFKFYRKHSQNDEESYYSAMRIFRGGRPEGGIVFYKDNVYLKGLIEVGAFFKQAMHEGTLHDIDLIFCGKITTDDVLRLKPLSQEGVITDPKYMPSWAKKSGELASHLAINDLTERFKLKR